MADNYHATVQEVVDLIESFSKQGVDGVVSLNEAAKYAYSESICNSVAKMEDDDEWQRLKAYVTEKYSTLVQASGLELYELLTSPRILSGELSLPQIRDIWYFIN
jgi:hypothetical protein